MEFWLVAFSRSYLASDRSLFKCSSSHINAKWNFFLISNTLPRVRVFYVIFAKWERFESCRCQAFPRTKNEYHLPRLYLYKETKLWWSSGIASIVYQAKINFIKTSSRVWLASLLRGSFVIRAIGKLICSAAGFNFDLCTIRRVER